MFDLTLCFLSLLIIKEDDSKKIGILISNIKEYKTNPNVKVNVDENESGSSGGLITALSIYNSLTKKDITNSEEVQGATLTIKNSSGTVIETWVSETKSKTVYLEPGTYILEETIAPDGYIKSTNKIEFVVNSDGKVLVGNKEVSDVVFTNEPILVTVSKRSITGSEELKGAKLKITDKDGNIVKDVNGNKLEWMSTDKPKIFQLKMGDYILSESIAPKGYELSETTIKFTINGEGKVLIDGKESKDNLIIFKNTPEPEQVPTGNTIVYIAGSLCLITLAISIYIIIKRKEL